MITTDKILDFLAGVTISLSVTVVSNNHGVVNSFIYGFIVASLLGIFKEVYDEKSGEGTPERNDTIATMVGGLVGVLIFFL